MSTSTTRPLSRAERALTTRRRMVGAAYDIFSREGFAGTTIAAVAQQAGVAVPTIYYTFGTKVALLGEALGAAIVGLNQWREPPREPFQIVEMLPIHRWWAALHAAPRAGEALEIFVKHGTDILQRVAPLMPALHGATGDPEGLELVRVSEQRRVESYREVVKIIAAKPTGLRADVSPETATDITLALLSAESYRAFADRDWTHQQCTELLTRVIAAETLATGSPSEQG